MQLCMMCFIFVISYFGNELNPIGLLFATTLTIIVNVVIRREVMQDIQTSP